MFESDSEMIEYENQFNVLFYTFNCNFNTIKIKLLESENITKMISKSPPRHAPFVHT